MYKMVNMLDYSEGIDKAIAFYYAKWGKPSNFTFFRDAIIHSHKNKSGIPRFYLLMKENEIVGCIGLVINDLISRHDLYPWIVGVYVVKNEREKQLGRFMMSHVESEAKNAGFNYIYLTTELDGYYEKYGWTRIEDGYEITGEPTKIYRKQI